MTADAGRGGEPLVLAVNPGTGSTKVALYRGMTDRELDMNMNAMGPDYAWYVSDRKLRGSTGVLILSHGVGENSDRILKEAFEPIGAQRPTAIGFGMAMMGSAHLQAAVDDLRAAKVTVETRAGMGAAAVRLRNLPFTALPLSADTIDEARHFAQRLEASLRGDLKAADRFHLVAEKLDSHRLQPVGSEDIEQPAAN